MKHTPWPWKWKQTRGNNFFEHTMFTMKANAHLIAAAPDLYEACLHFFEWHADHFDDFDPEINAQLLCLSNEVENAVNKAEGR